MPRFRLTRPALCSQPFRLRTIDLAISIDRHAIIAPRLFRRDQAVKHVVTDVLWIALPRIAEAAATRQLQANRIARRHGLTSLGADRPTGAQRDLAGTAGLTAAAPARRVAHALEVAQERQRISAGAAELDHLTKPDAEPARPAGAVAKFAAIKHHRRHAFGRLDRDGAHAGGKRSGAQAILLRPRAGAAAMKNHSGEFRQRVGIGARLDLIDQRAAAEDLRIP